MTDPLKLARLLALVTPLALLGGALAFQFWGGLYPCEMCWWQRYGHIAALVLALGSFALPARRWPVALAALALGVAGLIGAYHAGVEYGWWMGLTGCTSTVHFDGGDPARGIDLKALLSTRPAGAHVYVCGPIGLIKAVKAAASDWPKGTVHHELFKGSEADLAPVNNDQPFDIVLKKAGRTFTVPADKSILAVLKAEGFKIKTLCTTGRCGTCRVTYLSGKVDHRDDVLDDDEKDSVLQVCVSRAMPGETLVLDL